MDFSRFKPAVDKKILILMAGLMWIGTGAMLLRFTVKWLAASPLKDEIIFFSAGFLIALPIHHFGFLRLADKNLKRLLPVTGKKCLFSFMTWKSYLIIPVMISMGIALRHSGLPRQYLSVVYGGIGLALFLSGLRYLRFFIMLLTD